MMVKLCLDDIVYVLASRGLKRMEVHLARQMGCEYYKNPDLTCRLYQVLIFFSFPSLQTLLNDQTIGEARYSVSKMSDVKASWCINPEKTHI